jgi:hypothetical protein
MIYIPEKQYVGFQHRKEQGGDIVLGFATPFATDKAYEKRKATVDSWANGYENYKAKDPTRRPSAVLDNVLAKGFEIARSVRRSGWNGGNVLWRIVDPRGFELEISSANLASILDCNTISTGVIKGKCIWGRDGAANILLPEQSEPYQEAVKLTQLKNDVATKKVSLRDVSIGNIIKLSSDEDVVYLGKYYLVEYEWADKSEHKISKVVERYAVQEVNTKTVSLASNLKIAATVNGVDIMTTQEATEIVNNHLSKETFGRYVYATPNKITTDDISLGLESLPPGVAPTIDDLFYATKTKAKDTYVSRYTPATLYAFIKIGEPNQVQLISHQDRLDRERWGYNHYGQVSKAIENGPNIYPCDTIENPSLKPGGMLRFVNGGQRGSVFSKVDIAAPGLQWYKLVMYCKDARIEKLRQ